MSENRVEQLSLSSWGAGIYNAAGGTLEISASKVANNSNVACYSCRAIGAGLANLGSALVQRSVISGNIAHPYFEATIGGFGGGIYNGGELVVDSSVISDNLASGDWSAIGGGIANGFENGAAGTVTVRNSTIANNWAFVTGNDNFHNPRGGGISSDVGGVLDLNHTTIAGNLSGGGLPGYGGGISSSGFLYMRNTILGHNVASNGSDLSGGLTNSSYNLIQISAGGAGYDDTDLLDVDPKLGPLNNNGGPTFTVALLLGSPAIDAGDNANAPPWDQRGPGFPRIVNSTIDIGAFEVQASGAPSVCIATAVQLGGGLFHRDTGDVQQRAQHDLVRLRIIDEQTRSREQSLLRMTDRMDVAVGKVYLERLERLLAQQLTDGFGVHVFDLIEKP